MLVAAICRWERRPRVPKGSTCRRAGGNDPEACGNEVQTRLWERRLTPFAGVDAADGSMYSAAGPEKGLHRLAERTMGRRA